MRTKSTALKLANTELFVSPEQFGIVVTWQDLAGFDAAVGPRRV